MNPTERQARFRAHHKDQQPAAIVRTRRGVDRRSRPQRWRDAVRQDGQDGHPLKGDVRLVRCRPL
jgi:hypothetical protein